MDRQFNKPTKLEPPLIIPILFSAWMLLWKNGLYSILGLWFGYFSLMGLSLLIDFSKMRQDALYLKQEMKKGAEGQDYDTNIWKQFIYLKGKYYKEWEECKTLADSWAKLKMSKMILQGLDDDYQAIEKLCTLSWRTDLDNPEFLPIVGKTYRDYFAQKRTINLIKYLQLEDRIQSGDLDAALEKESLINAHKIDREVLQSLLTSSKVKERYSMNSQLLMASYKWFEHEQKVTETILRNSAEATIRQAQNEIIRLSSQRGENEREIRK